MGLFFQEEDTVNSIGVPNGQIGESNSSTNDGNTQKERNLYADKMDCEVRRK